jgi:hypothetical protein
LSDVPLIPRPFAGDSHSRIESHILMPIADVRRRARWYIALDGLTHLLVAFITAGAVQLLLDRWLRLSLDQRALVNVVITVFWLWVLYRRVLTRLLRPLPDTALAAAIDRANPELHDQLATAVQFAAGAVGPADRNSPALVRAVMEDACRSAERVAFQRVLNHKAAKTAGIELAALAGGIGFAFLLMPQIMPTWFQRNWLMREIPWPQDTHITPIGYDGAGTRRVPEGDELEIVGQIHGDVPDRISLEWWTASGRNGSETMMLVGETRARVSLGPLTESVNFRIVGGDERTREYAAIAVHRPAITRTVVRITPPPYTGLEVTTLEQQTVLEVLKGATVRIEADVNKPLRSARFVGPNGEAGSTTLARPNALVVDLSEPVAGVYVFELVDLDGWDNRRNLRYTLKVVPDLAPTVRAVARDVGDAVTPNAEIPIELSFTDTYGLSRVALMTQRGEDPPGEVALGEFTGPRRDFQTELRLEIASLNVQPGQRIRIWAEAADIDPAGPNVGRSQAVEFRILSATDLAAELAGREQELRQEFERLISEQSGLKDALDRLLPTLPDIGAMPPAAAQRLANLARRQEAYAARVLSLRRGFAQILAEMHTSKIAKSADERRINDRIATPMEDVGGHAMPKASASLSELRRQASRAEADRVPVVQADILRQMRSILTHMLELEGFREAVALLQEIITDQRALHGETSSALSNLLDEIIGPGNSEPLSPPAKP